MRWGEAPSAASIIYGTPPMTERLKQKIREGRVTLSSRYMAADDPWWVCTGCGLQMRRGEE